MNSTTLGHDGAWPSSLPWRDALRRVRLAALILAMPLCARAGEESAAPVARVQVTEARTQALSETIETFGTVAASVEGARHIVAPFECRVRRVLAAPGQSVAGGDALLELDLDVARKTLDLARQMASNVEARFTLKLATNEEVLQARQALLDAESRWSSLKAGDDGTVPSPVSGIVSKLDVQAGDIVPAQTLLVEIASASTLVARVGVEPDEMNRVKVGQAVELDTPTHHLAAAATSSVAVVTRGINAVTSLVDVIVPVPDGSDILLGDLVRAHIAVAAVDVLAVPRSAAVPDGDGFAVFTVKDGHAVKHAVQLGMESGNFVEVTKSDLKAGDTVVSVGSYELADGMAVSVEASP